MPLKRYTIAFKIDDALAQAAIKRSISGLEKLEKAAARVAAAIAQAHMTAANQMAASSQRVAQSQRLIEQAAIRSSIAMIRGMGASQRSTAQLNASVLQLNRMLSATRQNAGGAAAGLGQMGQAAGGATANLQGFARGLGLISAGAIGLHEVRAGITAIETGLRNARDYAKETAENNLKLYDTMRELASLKGQKSPTARTVASVALLGLESGLRLDEAREYDVGFESDIFAARNKGNIRPTKGTPEQLEKQIKLAGAKFAAAKQVDPKVAANMVTAIGQGRPLTRVEDVEAEIALMLQNLQEGKGTTSELSDQVMRARGTMIAGGWSANTADVGAYISTLSLNNPSGRTATRLESIISQITKATADPDHQGGLARLGITAQNRDLSDILDKLAPHIEEADKQGEKGGFAALRDLGFTDSRALIEIYKAGQERVLLKKQLARNKAGLGTPEAVTKTAEQFRADMKDFSQEIGGENRIADARVEAANFLRGLPGEQLAVERKGAAADLIAQRKIKTPTAEIMKAIEEGTFAGHAMTFGGKNLEERTIDNEVAKRLMGQARAKGLTEEQIRRAAPDLMRAGEGDTGGWFAGQIGDDVLGLQVQNLKDIIKTGKSGPVTRAAARSIQGLTIDEQLKALTEERQRAGAAAPLPPPAIGPAGVPGPGAMLGPGGGNFGAGLSDDVALRLVMALEANTAATLANTPAGVKRVAMRGGPNPVLVRPPDAGPMRT